MKHLDLAARRELEQIRRATDAWFDWLRRRQHRLRTGDEAVDAILDAPPHFADLAFFQYRLGTAIVWGEASATTIYGGYTTTATMSLDALAAGSGRMGAEADLGADPPEFLLVYFGVETGTAPTAGGTAEAYLAWSPDGTNYPSGVTGSDGAWPSDGNEDEWKVQLGLPAVVFSATNDGTTVERQNGVLVPVCGRYVVPVIDNNLSQAFRDETTASDNGSGVVAIPVRRVATST